MIQENIDINNSFFYITGSNKFVGSMVEILKELNNDVKKAVEESEFGPPFMYTDETNPLEKQANQMAWQLYLHLITPLMKQACEATPNP